MKIICAVLLLVPLALAQTNREDFKDDIDEIWARPTANTTTTTTTPTPGAPTFLGGDGYGSGGCICVEYYNCDPETNMTLTDGIIDGFGKIDIRFGQGTVMKCPHFLDVCCFPSKPDTVIPDRPVDGGGEPVPTVPTPPTRPPVTPPPTLPPTEQIHCGIRNPKGVGFSITGNTNHEAEYAEFPWMVAVLRKNWDQSNLEENLALCGGSLIHEQVVLTGAHCVDKFKDGELRIRAGEWDTQTGREQYPYQERDVQRIIMHEQFNGKTVYNDIALLVLKNPVDYAANVKPVCLPRQGEVFRQRECFVTGWGKKSFGKEGQLSVILKKIDVPIVSRDKCQSNLRKTRLGKLFNLHESFICAGGEAGKDACTGDGGGPLVCPNGPNPNRYEQAGIVAWGIGCGQADIPGVYANVALYRNWIDSHMKKMNFGTSSYTV